MQNILPLFTSAIPMACYTLPIVFGVQADNIVTYATMCLTLVPIFNPAITILVISPYKSNVLRWLDKLMCGVLKRRKLTTKTTTLTKSVSAGTLQLM
ncbi:unnamed protein product [Bursaphelenchus okinawaensis]|uniref:Uncharacterized protein n=1 Tax=Bursaphelenchus okinawaensis TaxID=465554 RepID=A0A811L278_9BILA|nr:unnamed protein product [Bursaphelenchus okinawaensis]CAG9117335.1 unnamed protein product [Bursaphelenchus okinawaensis]